MSGSTDRWLVVHVTSPSDELVHALSEGLVQSGASAVVERDLQLTTWVTEPDDVDAFVGGLRDRLEKSCGLPVEITVEARQGEDWLAKWREGLAPRRVGQRILVAPSWTMPDRNADDIVIFIDPQMAFGTGEHASTRGALHLLEDAVEKADTVLDVGAGSAILSIAAARLGAGHVLAVEADESALENARANVEDNGCADRVTIEHATVDAGWLSNRAAPFDVIVANVLSVVLRPLIPAFRSSLVSGGRLILGGILEEEAPAVIDDAANASLRLLREVREDGWWTGCFVAD